MIASSLWVLRSALATPPAANGEAFPPLGEAVAAPPRPVRPDPRPVPQPVPRPVPDPVTPDLRPKRPVLDIDLPARGDPTPCLVLEDAVYRGDDLPGTPLRDGAPARLRYCPLGDLAARTATTSATWPGITYEDVETHLRVEVGGVVLHAFDTRLSRSKLRVGAINAPSPNDPSPPPGTDPGADADVLFLGQVTPPGAPGGALTPAAGGTAYVIHYHFLASSGDPATFAQTDLPALLEAATRMPPGPVLVTTRHFSGERLPDGSPEYRYVMGEIRGSGYRWETHRIPSLTDLLRANAGR